MRHFVKNFVSILFTHHDNCFRGEDDNLEGDGENIDNGNDDKLSQDGLDGLQDGHPDGHHDGHQDTE